MGVGRPHPAKSGGSESRPMCLERGSSMNGVRWRNYQFGIYNFTDH